MTSCYDDTLVMDPLATQDQLSARSRRLPFRTQFFEFFSAPKWHLAILALVHHHLVRERVMPTNLRDQINTLKEGNVIETEIVEMTIHELTESLEVLVDVTSIEKTTENVVTGVEVATRIPREVESRDESALLQMVQQTPGVDNDEIRVREVRVP
jgi:hypothetical protein